MRIWKGIKISNYVSIIRFGTMRAVGFSYFKREKNHCEQPSAFPSSMRELVTPRVMHLMSMSFVNFKTFHCKSVRYYKRMQFLAKIKALTKNEPNLPRSIVYF